MTVYLIALLALSAFASGVFLAIGAVVVTVYELLVRALDALVEFRETL